MDFYSSLLILLLAMPAVGAIVVACLGQGRALLVRQISLGVTLAGAVIAVILGFAVLEERDLLGADRHFRERGARERFGHGARVTVTMVGPAEVES